jgi:hypothetical protein
MTQPTASREWEAPATDLPERVRLLEARVKKHASEFKLGEKP